MNDNFVQLKMNSICHNSILNYDLYIESGISPQLFRRKNISISASDFGNLKEMGHEFLLVPISQKNELLLSQQNHLPMMLEDSSIPFEKKLDIVTDTSVNILTELFQNPKSKESIQMAVNQSKHHVSLATSDSSEQKRMVTKKINGTLPVVHAVNVGNLSILLGMKCGITDPRELHDLGTGAVLHEIGKTLVDSNYYLRQNSSTRVTDNRLKNYPLIGVNMLKKTGVVSKGALPAILEHQERLDGSGFPKNIVQNQLSLIGRIVGICDFYDDAVKDNASYKNTPFQILRKMMASPDKFDIEIVKKFIVLLGETIVDDSNG